MDTVLWQSFFVNQHFVPFVICFYGALASKDTSALVSLKICICLIKMPFKHFIMKLLPTYDFSFHLKKFRAAFHAISYKRGSLNTGTQNLNWQIHFRMKPLLAAKFCSRYEYILECQYPRGCSVPNQLSFYCGWNSIFHQVAQKIRGLQRQWQKTIILGNKNVLTHTVFW